MKNYRALIAVLVLVVVVAGCVTTRTKQTETPEEVYERLGRGLGGGEMCARVYQGICLSETGELLCFNATAPTTNFTVKCIAGTCSAGATRCDRIQQE